MKSLVSFVFFLTAGFNAYTQQELQKPNILFIAIDDMNDWVGYLQTHPQVKTPNFDRLAKRGTFFTRAHCPAPICGPSRTAILSGLRPTSSGIYTNGVNYKRDMSTHISLPAYFRKHGYQVWGKGKIFHSGTSAMPADAFDEYGGKGASASPFSSADLRTELQDPCHEATIGDKTFQLPLNGMIADRHWGKNYTFDWGPLDLPDSLWDDTQTTDWAIEKLRHQHQEPFMLTVGFTRPHQPLFNPKRFHDLYPLDQVNLPQVVVDDLQDVPRAGSEYALAASTSGLHSTVAAYGEWPNAVSSYLAAISYVDFLVGRILAALDDSGYAENTWVVLWSDHGWHLGEKEHWGKATGWYRSTRVPLIIVPPKKDRSLPRDQPCHELVNLLDLAPTLADLANIPTYEDWEGQSLLPLIAQPDQSWREHTLTTFGYGNHTITTKNWQYIHYFDGTAELYHLQDDPDQFVNLASFPSYQDTLSRLRLLLPEERPWKYMIRHHNFKAIISAKDGHTKLFNLYHQNQSDERTDVASRYPGIVKEIHQWLEVTKPNDKYLTMTPETLPSTSFLIENSAEFQAAMHTSQPGDSIIWKNGIYRDIILDINRPGLIIKAQDPGQVTFSDRIEIKLSANGLVFSGFQFVDGRTEEDVLKVEGSHIVLEDLNFSNLQCHYYLNILPAAQHVVTQYCNFEHKPQVPNSSVVQVQVHKTQPGYHVIRYCSFKNHTAPKDAGGDYGIEALRIGYSYQSTLISRTTVEYCYFSKCNGDGEIISSKARENIYRYNTFDNNGESHFTLRHGKDNVVYGNFFFRGAGIRIKEGQNHMVYNNYFATGDWFSLRLMNHPADPLDNIVIAHNSFVDSGPILLGGKGSTPPEGVKFVGNLFSGMNGHPTVNPTGREIWTDNITDTSWENQLEGVEHIPFEMQRKTSQLTMPLHAASYAFEPSAEIKLLDIPVLADDPTIKLDIMQNERKLDRPLPGCMGMNTKAVKVYVDENNSGPRYP